ncbi:hypothetical protein [Legionella hackeliae]|uniref:Uncharacterized protein n=1 Tax=Legionella hackeliae TaxID=449 RepID=A0A0A8URS2_LEGHA|nr:hypothetical protein [Legionella hackeliae]KTD08767.1 hypothetical protein Lhac_2990 [Legionella hackeliae]CEK10196.1 protein of unknown function [Legionella hackeliae]STX46920.1 Uncharacterised protein [Legionella hackeliae]
MPEKIEDDLKTFADKLLTAIDDTAEGQQKLVEIFEQTKKNYTYEDSPFWSWVYSFSRKRPAQLNQTIEALKIFPAPYIRLQEFQKFLKTGQWKTTSANTELFVLLINSVPGYEREERDYIYAQILRPLRRILLNKIKLMLQQYEVSERQAAERNKELAFMRDTKNRKLEAKEPDVVYVFNDGERAKLFAQKNPDKQVFFLDVVLVADERKWQLSWYDLTGKATSLTITAELAAAISSLEVELKKLLTISASVKDVAAEKKLLDQLFTKSEIAKEIKSECTKVLQSVLNKTQVLFNPIDDQLANLVSTYVVKKENQQIKLYWYDSIGKRNLLKLEDYPDFLAWISQKESLTKNDILRLKVYLRSVDIRHHVDEVKQSKIQNMLKEKHGIALITTDDWTTIPSYRLIKDTYILTREPDAKTGEWVLYQRQRGGTNAKINVQTWPNPDAMDLFQKLLANNDAVSAANLSIDVKEKLRDIIKQSSSIFHKESCQAVDEFSPADATNFKPSSFVLTKKNDVWQLYYIDSLQKCIRVTMKDCPSQTSSLLAKWEGEPTSLSITALRELANTLVGFKPAQRIDLTKFSDLESIFGMRQEKPKLKTVDTEPTTIDKEAVTTNAAESDAVKAKKPGKLTVKDFAIARLFNHKESESEKEEGTVLGISF